MYNKPIKVKVARVTYININARAIKILQKKLYSLLCKTTTHLEFSIVLKPYEADVVWQPAIVVTRLERCYLGDQRLVDVARGDHKGPRSYSLHGRVLA